MILRVSLRDKIPTTFVPLRQNQFQSTLTTASLECNQMILPIDLEIAVANNINFYFLKEAEFAEILNAGDTRNIVCMITQMKTITNLQHVQHNICHLVHFRLNNLTTIHLIKKH